MARRRDEEPPEEAIPATEAGEEPVSAQGGDRRETPTPEEIGRRPTRPMSWEEAERLLSAGDVADEEESEAEEERAENAEDRRQRHEE